MNEQEDKFPMRINKYLALTNHSTRRGADELIKKHLVLINGRFAELGDKVMPTDAIEVRQNKKALKYEYYAYNKPRGVVTLAPIGGQRDIKSTANLKDMFPIGRLDKESEGLLIMSNDGRITDRLLNPMHAHDKEYLVTTKQKLRNNFKDKMESGVDIGDMVTKPAKINILNDNTFTVTLTEGKKHQIRRMCDALFAEVDTLKRIRIMNISIGKLGPNSYRKIDGEELDTFLKSLGLL